jgi:Ni/Co efflux regulator RcnB
MSQFRLNAVRALLVGAALGLCAAPALAEKPEWAGQGKGKVKKAKKHENHGRGEGHDDRVKANAYFVDRHRVVVHEYYGREYRSGFCPPGLAKKNNGCMPPGQAKKWAVGRPLPGDVVFYEVPRRLVVEIGAPPPGHKYVRVAGDILLIAVGSSMVIDAIRDLGSI